MTVRTVTVGVGEIGVSASIGDKITALGLGSCVALVMLDIHATVAGLAHVALPAAASDRDRALRPLAYFADAGIEELIDAMMRAGGDSDPRRYIVKIAGGASLMDPNGIFAIGRKNTAELRTGLRQRGMVLRAADVGGALSRSVCVQVGLDQILVSSPGRQTWAI